MDIPTDPLGFFRDEALPPERAEEAQTIYRLIGRNVVLLQQMEQMLRHLLVNTNISSEHGSLAEQTKARAERVGTSGMGGLIKDYSRQVLKPDQSPKADDGMHFSLSFKLSHEGITTQEREQQMKRIVLARNQLIHALPFQWVPGNPANYEALRSWLEKLFGESVTEWHALRLQVLALQQVGKLLIDRIEAGYFDLDAEGKRKWNADRGIAPGSDQG